MAIIGLINEQQFKLTQSVQHKKDHVVITVMKEK